MKKKDIPECSFSGICNYKVLVDDDSNTNEKQNDAKGVNIQINKETIVELINLIDTKRLLSDNEILIQNNGDNVIIVDGSDKFVETFDVEQKNSDGKGETHKQHIKVLCEISFFILNFLGLDYNSWADYRFAAGLRLNCDETFEELRKVVNQETIDKLENAGYEIIKNI